MHFVALKYQLIFGFLNISKVVMKRIRCGIAQPTKKGASRKKAENDTLYLFFFLDAFSSGRSGFESSFVDLFGSTESALLSCFLCAKLKKEGSIS